MNIIWLFLIFATVATSTTPLIISDTEDEVNVTIDVQKMAELISEINKQKTNSEVKTHENCSLLSLHQNKNVTSFEYLYSNQVEEVDDSVELSIFLILYGDKGRAAKRFNANRENVRYTKLIVTEIVHGKPENMIKLLEFVDLIEPYESKIFMIYIMYQEFMKSLDTSMLVQFKSLVVNLMAMSQFNDMIPYYKDQFETINSVLVALEAKIETFMPKEKPVDVTLQDIKGALDDVSEKCLISQVELSRRLDKRVDLVQNNTTQLLTDLEQKIENNVNLAVNKSETYLQDQINKLSVEDKLITELFPKIPDWKSDIINLKLDIANNFMKLIKIGLEIRDAENSVENGQYELADLKSMLPELVKGLTLNEVNLRQNSDCGILYALTPGNSLFSKKYQDNRLDGKTTTGMPADGDGWRLEMTDDDQTVYIKNTLSNKYLYATDKTGNVKKKPYFSSFRHVVLATSPNGSGFKWSLTYGSHKTFSINSLRHSSEYLVLSLYYHDNPNIFVTTTKSPQLWRIEPC